MLTAKKFNRFYIKLPLNPKLGVNKTLGKKPWRSQKRPLKANLISGNYIFPSNRGTRFVTALADSYIQRSVTNKYQVVLIFYYALPPVGIEKHYASHPLFKKVASHVVLKLPCRGHDLFEVNGLRS